MESWSQRVVESSSLESYRSLGLLGLRDDYLSGPFPYSSLVYKVTQVIINSLLAARGPVPDTPMVATYLLRSFPIGQEFLWIRNFNPRSWIIRTPTDCYNIWTIDIYFQIEFLVKRIHTCACGTFSAPHKEAAFRSRDKCLRPRACRRSLAWPFYRGLRNYYFSFHRLHPHRCPIGQQCSRRMTLWLTRLPFWMA